MNACLVAIGLLCFFHQARVSATTHHRFSDFGEESASLAGERMARLAQSLIDKDISAPGPFLGSKKFEKIGPVIVQVGQVLYRQRLSTIFPVASDARTLLKYEVNCDSLNEVHPLVREAVVLKELENSKFVPRLLYLSGPAKFGVSSSSKTGEMKMRASERKKCEASSNSSVRMMAIENAGVSVSDIIYHFPQGVGLEMALLVAIELIEAIEMMHERDIVHGDIHPGNVILGENGGGVKLIDFGLSFFHSDFEGKSARIRAPLSYIHCYFSPFNLQGSRFAKRDDLFKALHVLAVLMIGSPFVRFCVSLHDDAEKMMRLKNEEYYFSVPGQADVIEDRTDLTGAARREIKRHLTLAMDIARDQPEIDAPARSREVLDHLEAALKFLD